MAVHFPRQLKTVVLPAALLVSTTLWTSTANAQAWSHAIEPYAIAASIEGDTSIGRATGVPVDVDFSTILENLEMAAMVHYEAHHESGWGLALDYGFMDLGADISNARGGVVDASLRQGIFEALAVKRQETDAGYLDITFGLRWWDNDIDVLIDPAILPGSASVAIEEDWIDLVIGARSFTQLNEKWGFQMRGDIGGLGMESDFTASVSGGFLYALGEKWQLDLQYKATWVDFEDGSAGTSDYFAYDTVTHGPLIGFIYNF